MRLLLRRAVPIHARMIRRATGAGWGWGRSVELRRPIAYMCSAQPALYCRKRGAAFRQGAVLTNNFADDLAAVAKIDVVPTILEVVCSKTGAGFAAAPRLTG